MDVKALNFNDDLEHINSWLKHRGHPIAERDEMPEIGFVAWEGERRVAAVCLHRCEGNYAWINGLVTNPEISPIKRSNAIDLVVQKLIATAKELKIKGILGFSVDEGTLKRSEKHGFRKMPHTMILLRTGV